MKQTRSLFRRFLKVHFLFIFLPPIVLIFISAFLGLSINGDSINREDLNTLNLFYIIVLLFGFIIVAFVRITSYNVCYTKLLRYRLLQDIADKPFSPLNTHLKINRLAVLENGCLVIDQSLIC